MLVRYWRQSRGNFGINPVAADFRADSIDREPSVQVAPVLLKESRRIVRADEPI
jgi:hypothetical protein